MVPCRTLVWVAVIACGALFAADARAATFVRQIYDYGTNRSDGLAYLNLFTAVPRPYTFGRAEGQPARGANPISGKPAFGSTDVDTLYDTVPLVHQYYLDKFGRNGPNGFGGIGDGITLPFNYYRIFANHSPGNPPSANMVAHPGQSQFDVGAATPDVIGHEMFHFVEAYEIDLSEFSVMQTDPVSYYRDPSLAQFGSIMEGLSDFFGEAFERYVTGTNDWRNSHRSLVNPSSLPESNTGLIPPDHLLSSDFLAPLNGNNFTYVNAGVINKASYLAVEGGLFNGVQVEGLGFNKVEQIWYRAVAEYFTPTETFAMAYDHLLLSANDLYGPADDAKLQQALRAVELNGVAVPEPSSLALCVIGMVGFVGAYYRRRQSRAA